jgi:hypothetical protein
VTVIISTHAVLEHNCHHHYSCRTGTHDCDHQYSCHIGTHDCHQQYSCHTGTQLSSSLFMPYWNT